MKFKSIIAGSLFLLMSCNPSDKPTRISEDNFQEPRCTYTYFQNDMHELDSTLLECPDIKPDFPMKFHPLNIDTMKVWHRG